MMAAVCCLRLRAEQKPVVVRVRHYFFYQPVILQNLVLVFFRIKLSTAMAVGIL